MYEIWSLAISIPLLVAALLYLGWLVKRDSDHPADRQALPKLKLPARHLQKRRHKR